jgi:ATP-dependent Clp protease protease subunit
MTAQEPIVEYYCDDLFFTGEVTPSSAHQLAKLVRKIEAERENSTDKDITLYLSSPGGEVNSSMRTHDIIKKSSLNVAIIAEGMVASGATLLMCAGKSVCIAENAFLMLHEAQSYFQNTYTNNKNYLAYVDRLMTKIVDIYNTRLKQPISKSDLAFDWFIDSRTALDLGLVDKVI